MSPLASRVPVIGDGLARLLVKLVIDRFHHRMRYVERGQIEQFERPEPETRLFAHDAIDIREARNAFSRDAQAFGVHAASGVIDDEARHVLCAHRRVAHVARERHQRIAGARIAAQAVDDFDHAH